MPSGMRVTMPTVKSVPATMEYTLPRQPASAARKKWFQYRGSHPRKKMSITSAVARQPT